MIKSYNLKIFANKGNADVVGAINLVGRVIREQCVSEFKGSLPVMIIRSYQHSGMQTNAA